MEENKDIKRIEKLKSSRGCFNFEGSLVTRLCGGYMVYGETFTNEMDVLDHIQKTCSILNESIVVVNTGSIECINDNENNLQ